jgi:WD40 repeat protein
VNVPSTRARQVHPDAPWLGLRPFTEEVRNYFFGRTAEVTELFERVTAKPLTVLFGPSGLGKTSLLQAAVVPRLREAGYVPVILRLDHHDDAPPLELQFVSALKSALSPGILIERRETPLWLLLHDPDYGLCAPFPTPQSTHSLTRTLLDEPKPGPRTETGALRLVVILDQFEEIFTLGQLQGRVQESERFLRTLADIVENRVPADLREQLALDEDLTDRLDYSARPCKILLSLREDYLHQLERFRKLMPSMMDNRMELRLLNGRQALEATIEPGKIRCQTHPELPPIVSEETGQAIVRFVAGVQDTVPLKDINAVPPLLSLLCAELNAGRSTSSAEIQRDQLKGRAEDILANFYERCFETHPLTVRAFIEDHLLSPDGFRQSVNYGTFVHEMAKNGVDAKEADTIITNLVDARLLVSDDRAGIRRIELTHDILTRMARRSRDERKKREQNETFRKQRERRQKKFIWLALAGLCTLVGCISVPLMVWALKERQTAQSLVTQAALADLSACRDQWVANRPRDAMAHLARAFHYDAELQVAAQAVPVLSYLPPLAGTLLILKGHAQAVTFATFSPDASRILTASEDHVARIWDAQSGNTIGTPLLGHTGAVSSAAFNFDGTQVITASADGTARIWDPKTGQLIVELKGHGSFVRTAAFNRDATVAVTASDDQTARIWDTQSGKTVTVLSGHSGAIRAALFNPDGSLVVTASEDHTARIWDTRSGRILAIMRGHTGPVYTAVFSADSTRIVTASYDKTARVWNATSAEPITVLKGHSGPVYTAVFNPDGSRVLTSSHDKTARIWDAESATLIAELMGHSNIVRTAVFSPNATRVLTSSDDQSARLWDAQSGSLIAIINGHEKALRNAVFSPFADRVLTASEDHTARVWNAHSNNLPEFKGHPSAVYSAAFSPKANRVVTASEDGTGRIWNTRSGALINELKGHSDAVMSAHFSADGQRILTASLDKTVRLWDGSTGTNLAILEGHNGPVYSAVFSSDAKRILTASMDKTARLWDATATSVLTEFKGHQGAVKSAAFSPDERRVVSASFDHTARLWDAQTARIIAILEGHEGGLYSAVFSPDAKRVVTASTDQTARIWDVKTAESIRVLRGHSGAIYRAVFSPDSKRVLTASLDKTARIWDSETGDLLVLLYGHTDAVTSAIFSPDAKSVLTTSEDKTARLWNVLATTEPPPSWFADLLRIAGGRQFSPGGQLEDLSAKDWQDCRAKVVQSARADASRYGEIARRYLGTESP